MTNAGTLTSLRGRRTLAVAAALSITGLAVPAQVAHAAGEELTVTSPAITAGQAFTVEAKGLTTNASYRLALTGTSATDKTDLSESNSCRTMTPSAATVTCTITESATGSYDLKLLDANGGIVTNKAVSVGTTTTVTQPVATDRAGTADDRITLQYSPGVTWSVTTATDATVTLPNGTAVTSTTPLFDPATAKAGDKIDLKVVTTDGKASADVTVAAKAASGYVIPGGDQTHTLRVTSAATAPAALTIPADAQPVHVDQPGLANDSVTLRAVDGVQWYIGNTAVSFASGETSKTIKVTPDADKKVVIRAQAADGRSFSGGRLAEEFTLTYTDVPVEPTSSRVAGSDRVATSVEISKKYFDASTDTVYITNGWSYADALTAGPAAAKDNAPLLLTEPTKLSQSVIDEIKRLTPSNIKIVGGPKAVSAEVETQLRGLGQGSVQRLSGQDRIGTAVAVSRQWASVETAYVAYGWGFPDALSGGSGAAKQNAPLFLSMSDDMTDATIDRLKALGVKNVKLVGGTSVLNGTVANQAGSLGTATRYAGSDRYGTSAEVIKSVTGDGAKTAFLATGQDFADALAGIPAAKKSNAPLALMAPTCSPDAVRTELTKLGLTDVVRLGGVGVLGDFPLTKSCGW